MIEPVTITAWLDNEGRSRKWRRRQQRLLRNRRFLTPVTPVGGSLVVGVTTVPVGMWEGNWEGRAAEVTHTDGAGATSYRAFVIDAEWSFTMMYDTTDAAVAAGLTVGAIVTIKFLLGGGGKCDLVTNTTVLGIRRILDAKGETPIGVTIHGKGGVVTVGTTA